jgi:hypothetical protein
VDSLPVLFLKVYNEGTSVLILEADTVCAVLVLGSSKKRTRYCRHDTYKNFEGLDVGIFDVDIELDT